ncbi:HupE/UreJ family protein [Ferrovibrio sp.]|uniref:HupE/UreJ family protein n=1 Tax=Ferrovibrio sp. TaxID=1917215 RepID=UPI0025C5F934|nr:HupE/UreJ family protein [Ferrovibrio sp.]MBX3454925.1 HupE/UreJ family protein [Ferrovibrio sp.]
MSWLVYRRAATGAATFAMLAAIISVAAMLAAPAFAHVDGVPGHDHGLMGNPFMSGLGHPFGGLDHLLAMLAVGIWAMQQGGRALFAVPGAFVIGMAAGFALGQAGFALPLVETGIALSVLAFGLALALALRPPLSLAVAATLVFALFHGHAHGAEMPAEASALLYAGGMLIGTALLHGLGLALGRLAARTNTANPQAKLAGLLPRAAGIMLAVTGGVLLLA